METGVDEDRAVAAADVNNGTNGSTVDPNTPAEGVLITEAQAEAEVEEDISAAAAALVDSKNIAQQVHENQERLKREKENEAAARLEEERLELEQQQEAARLEERRLELEERQRQEAERAELEARELEERQRQEAAAVEEKFCEQNFRVLSEMRIFAKMKVVILDLVG